MVDSSGTSRRLWPRRRARGNRGRCHLAVERPAVLGSGVVHPAKQLTNVERFPAHVPQSLARVTAVPRSLVPQSRPLVDGQLRDERRQLTTVRPNQSVAVGRQHVARFALELHDHATVDTDVLREHRDAADTHHHGVRMSTIGVHDAEAQIAARRTFPEVCRQQVSVEAKLSTPLCTGSELACDMFQ